MITITNILLIILAYLIGSIPSSVWIGKIFFNTDIRKFGSKNAGTTNTFRVLGYKAGLPVLFIDILKGYFAVSLVLIFKNHNLTEIQIFNFQLILGLAAILGHIFPIFAKFKGGKGVATLLGIFLSIALFPTLISLFAFILILTLTKYVSVSSIIAGLIFPISINLIYTGYPVSLKIASIGIALIILITHRKNIKRLLNKEEAKFTFKNN